MSIFSLKRSDNKAISFLKSTFFSSSFVFDSDSDSDSVSDSSFGFSSISSFGLIIS